jgi:hypothetical protein
MSEGSKESNDVPLYVQTDALTINSAKSTETATTSATSASTSFDSRSFSRNNTPVSTQSQGAEFLTPAEILTPAERCKDLEGFEDLGISPGSFEIAFSDAQKKILDDCILEESFATTRRMNIRCIYYLYGVRYYWTKSRSDRIAAVKKCLETADARQRLSRIAISDATDKILMSPGSCDKYLNLALTAKIFFGDSNANGGFPKEAIIQFQRSRNCYLPAACVWYTLQCQVDLKNDQEAAKPLDMAQVARHYVIENDASLERRVINNKGGSAAVLASKITDREPLGTHHWIIYDFEDYEDTVMDVSGRDVQAKANSVLIHNLTGQKRFGIIGSFGVQPKLQELAEEEAKKPTQSGIGYWKFDGDDVNTEGEFIHLTDDTNIVASESERLRELWDQQKQDAKVRNEGRKDKMENILPLKLFGDGNTTCGTKQAGEGNIMSPDPAPSSGQHAMVLLGTFVQGEDIYFMLLNSWKSMPLILVSLGYLRTCKAKAYFLQRVLGKESKPLKRREGYVSECSFPDGGEDEHAPHFCLSFESEEE